LGMVVRILSEGLSVWARRAKRDLFAKLFRNSSSLGH
jgi:hypothetical protein